MFDSWILGYSMAVASTREGPLTIVGGPRYKHRGVVMTVEARGNVKKIDPHPWKVCVYNQLRLVNGLKRQWDAHKKKFWLIPFFYFIITVSERWILWGRGLCHGCWSRLLHWPGLHICPYVCGHWQRRKSLHLWIIWFGKWQFYPVPLN